MFVLDNKYGLVIQGPILDRGGFNCSDTITKVLSNFGAIFEQVILSTWDGESRHLSLSPAFDVQVLESSDPFIDEEPWPDNRLRQWVSSLNGILRVRQDLTHVVKIRTDQFFDLRLFINEFEENCRSHTDYLFRKSDGFLHALALYRSLDYALCDFAMVGPKALMRDFYSAQVEIKDVILTRSIDIPEVDSVRKFLFRSLSTFDFEVPRELCMPNIPSAPGRRIQLDISQDPALLALWEFSLRQVFSVSTEQVMRDLIWRGDPISQEYVSDTFAFKEEWLRLRQSLVLRRFSEATQGRRRKWTSGFLRGRRRAIQGNRGLLTKFLIALEAGHFRHSAGSIYWKTWNDRD